MWTCPSQASHASPAAKKPLMAAIRDVKGRMANKHPAPAPGVFLHDFNTKVLPPYGDCQFVGYDKIGDQSLEAPASANPVPRTEFEADAEVYKPVPFTDLTENFAGNGTAALGGYKACFGTPVDGPFDAAACTCVSDDMFEILEADSAARANMDPGSKL
ncbi:hypothetical protein CCACVL1_17489 [Corchorus capsularis]|uniref:Uncharacterized protein n=1 Tax=Corchorus capsularis TaxID=210143 RepID=A0A1R3HRN2_COCAP|nr:hypothetical protein CCACVL1_17489 [Corchorus capsularis]